MSDTSRYHRRGFGLKAEIAQSFREHYHSELVDEIRANGFTLRRGDLTIRVAREFGFCVGVGRAVEMAYETRVRFPDRRIYLTNEIIHNPQVNEHLAKMGVEFLHGRYGEGRGLDAVSSEDVVIIPAFGIGVQDLEALRRKGCVLVDTSCGSVVNVWRHVERCALAGFTCMIHGKADHEETKATCSRAAAIENGAYIVVRDIGEAMLICDYIRRGGDSEALRDRFRGACSPGFDPDRHLERIGLSNQTTMLSSESNRIAEAVRQAMIDRYGEAALDEHFRSFETICTATQDRQDAMLELCADPSIDLFLIVGGYNSSNTTHLAEIAGRHKPSYHICGPDCIVSAEAIRHKPPGGREETVATGWLPEGPCTVGMTSGASTPDSDLGATIRRLLEVRGIPSGPED